MGGFFRVTSRRNCILDVFFGTDYHSHLGTRRGGMAAFDPEKGLQREIHNIENSPFRTKFERASKAGIPAEVIEKKGCTQEAFEQKLEALLKAYDIDLIILAGFLTILSPAFTARHPRRILNIHPSLIPSFCGEGFYGLRVHEAALARGVKLTGATVHFVNEIPDGGEILLQKAVEILPGDTPEILQRRVMEQAEWKLLPRAAELVSQEIIKEKENCHD